MNAIQAHVGSMHNVLIQKARLSVRARMDTPAMASPVPILTSVQTTSAVPMDCARIVPVAIHAHVSMGLMVTALFVSMLMNAYSEIILAAQTLIV